MVDAKVAVAVGAVVSSVALAVGVVAGGFGGDKFNILTISDVDFDSMVTDPRFNQWFINNLRCSQAGFHALVKLLLRYMTHYNFRFSKHSFEKKVAMLLYFLGSEGGYRETAGALGVSKSWCLH
ncbi:putative nuclease harbi1 [Aphanomyces cochlioides]|nr:putative nuclease harbi1 [Aphanomyces cochlioides]